MVYCRILASILTASKHGHRWRGENLQGVSTVFSTAFIILSPRPFYSSSCL